MAAFSKEEEIFIVDSFVKNQSPITVKRAFVKKYRDHPKGKRWLNGIDPRQFSRVYDRFKQNGIAKTPNPGQARGVEGQKTKPEKIKIIENYFTQNPMNSLLDASNDLKMPKSTISRILRKYTSLKPYKISVSQVLTADHKKQRLEFCEWLLKQTDEFVSDLLITRNEKWFQLSQVVTLCFYSIYRFRYV